MSDTDTFNIINIIKINIHSIGAEDIRDDERCENLHNIQRSNHVQDTGRTKKCYTNKDNISNSTNNNTNPMVEAKAN